MIRHTILVALLAIAGCGGHHHTAAPPAPPPPTPFADIAGTYQATVTDQQGVYVSNTDPVGTAYDATIAASGTVTVGAATYTLTRLPDGSFKTKGRSIAGGLTEFGTAPADLRGTEDFLVVKLGGG